MKEIIRIEAVSLAKVVGLLVGGVYLIIGILINLAVLIFGLGSVSGLDFLGFGSGIIATILVSLLIGLMVFVVVLIAGFLYNFIANYFGGVIVLFEDRSVVEERLREARAAKLALRAEKKKLKAERNRLQNEKKKKAQANKVAAATRAASPVNETPNDRIPTP
jgi:hypothetical protein